MKSNAGRFLLDTAKLERWYSSKTKTALRTPTMADISKINTIKMVTTRTTTPTMTTGTSLAVLPQRTGAARLSCRDHHPQQRQCQWQLRTSCRFLGSCSALGGWPRGRRCCCQWRFAILVEVWVLLPIPEQGVLPDDNNDSNDDGAVCRGKDSKKYEQGVNINHKKSVWYY